MDGGCSSRWCIGTNAVGLRQRDKKGSGMKKFGVVVRAVAGLVGMAGAEIGAGADGAAAAFCVNDCGAAERWEQRGLRNEHTHGGGNLERRGRMSGDGGDAGCTLWRECGFVWECLLGRLQQLFSARDLYGWSESGGGDPGG